MRPGQTETSQCQPLAGGSLEEAVAVVEARLNGCKFFRQRQDSVRHFRFRPWLSGGVKRQRKPKAKAGSDKKKQKKDQEDDKADADEASEVSGEAGGSAEAGSKFKN